MGANSVRTGARFEHEVSHCLSRCGFMPIGTDVDVFGTKVDLLVRNKWGNETLVECKAGRGLRSADVVKRLVGMALYVNAMDHTRGPILPVTTALPRKGTVADNMIRIAVRQGLIYQPETIATLESQYAPWINTLHARNHYTIFHEEFTGLLAVPTLRGVT